MCEGMKLYVASSVSIQLVLVGFFFLSADDTHTHSELYTVDTFHMFLFLD